MGIRTKDDGNRSGDKDTPGDAFKRNFNRNPRGKFGIRMQRGKGSRSKSSHRS